MTENSLAFPVNITSLPFLPWVPENGSRSTWSILSTCVSTLVLCAWSAVHVDIPTRKRCKKRDRILKWIPKLGWVLVGVSCPAMLLVLALSQFYTAICLVRLAHRWIPGTEPHDTLFERLILWKNASSKCFKVRNESII
jgi:hypothetical protein